MQLHTLKNINKKDKRFSNSKIHFNQTHLIVRNVRFITMVHLLNFYARIPLY